MPAPAATHAPLPAERLRHGMQECLRGSRRLRAWLALERGLALALGGVLMVCLVDACCTLPGVVRVVLLWLSGTLFGFMLWHVGRLWNASRSEQSAVAGEKDLPWLPVSPETLHSGLEFAVRHSFSTRLGSRRLQEALVAQVAEQLQWRLRWPYPRVQGWPRLLLLLVPIIFFLLLMLAPPSLAQTALRRWFLPLEPQAWVVVQVESLEYGARGRPYVLRALVTGWPVREALVEWTDEIERQQMIVPVEWDLERGQGRLAAELTVRSRFRYRLQVRDAVLEHTVRMADPPTLPQDSPQVEIHAPAYTGLPVLRLSQPGNLEVLHGSVLQFSGHAPTSVTRLHLALHPVQERIAPVWQTAMVPDPTTGTFHVMLDTRAFQVGEYSCVVSAENAEGLQTDYRYALHLVPDPPPHITVQATTKGNPVFTPPNGWLTLQVNAEDRRYGLRSLHLLVTPAEVGAVEQTVLLHWLSGQLRLLQQPIPLMDVLVSHLDVDVAAAWQRSLICGNLGADPGTLASLVLWTQRPARWEATFQIPAALLPSGQCQVAALATDQAPQGTTWSQPLTVQVLHERPWRQRRAAQWLHWLDQVRGLPDAGDARRRGAEELARELAPAPATMLLSLRFEDAADAATLHRLRKAQRLLGRLASTQATPQVQQSLETLEHLFAQGWLQEQAYAVLEDIEDQLRLLHSLTLATMASPEDAPDHWRKIGAHIHHAQEAWSLLWHQGRNAVPHWPETGTAQNLWAAWQAMEQAGNQQHAVQMLTARQQLQTGLQSLREDFLRRAMMVLQNDLNADREFAHRLSAIARQQIRPQSSDYRWLQAQSWLLLVRQCEEHHPEAARWLEQAAVQWQESGEVSRTRTDLEAAAWMVQGEVEVQEDLWWRLQRKLLRNRCQRLETALEAMAQERAASLHTPRAIPAWRERLRPWLEEMEADVAWMAAHPWHYAAWHRLLQQGQALVVPSPETCEFHSDFDTIRQTIAQLRLALVEERSETGPPMHEMPYAASRSFGPETGLSPPPLASSRVEVPQRSMLPPQLRRDLEHYAQERFPPQYAEECARYYRTLLEMQRTPGK